MRTDRTDPPDAGLNDALVQAAFAVMSILNRVGALLDLSPTQLRVLGILRDNQPQMQQLAEHLGLDKSSVSGLVNRAEKRGLVQRRPGALDGRTVLVQLTDAGRNLVVQVEQAVYAQIAEMLEPLTGRDRSVLQGLLTKAVGPGLLA